MFNKQLQLCYFIYLIEAAYRLSEFMKFLKSFFSLLNVLVLCVFFNYQGKTFVVSLRIAIFLHIVCLVMHSLAHEIGHFIGGIISDYKPLYLQLGLLSIVWKENKPNFIWKKTFNNQCIMIPTQTNPVRFKVYNLGGIFANLLVAVISFAFVFLNSFWLSLFFGELVLVGLYKVLVNIIPHKTKSIPNDGYVLKILNKYDEIQRDYVMYLQLYSNFLLKEPIDLNIFRYKRNFSRNNDELIFYEEIQNILKMIEAEHS